MAQPVAVATTPEPDPRFRPARSRLAMFLILDKGASVEVRESRHGGRLLVVGPTFVERSVDLNVVELRQLAAICNRIARTVARRHQEPEA